MQSTHEKQLTDRMYDETLLFGASSRKLILRSRGQMTRFENHLPHLSGKAIIAS